jgi:hypothetical protein
MEKSILKKIILENQQRIPGLEIIRRDYLVEPKANYIFTGQRRAGKTFFVFGLIQEMIREGIPVESVLYINFEDERLIGLEVNDFDTILESYREIYSHNPLLFFDEIQNISGWQKFARRMADSGYSIFITGSNSEMLSSEMASTLGGRFMVMEIETLSFGEFLLFNGIVPDAQIEFSPSRFEVIRLFGRYFAEGGFPELTRFNDKKEYLSNLFQKVFLGDIISRYQVRNPFALRLLVKKLAESTMDEVSFNRMRNIISSTGLQIGTATVIEYLKHLEEAFLISPLDNYQAKISSRASKKKYYFRDNGILSLFLMDPPSFQLETLVYNHLRVFNGSNVYYLRNGYEVDFFVPGELLIQVCYGLDEPATRKREVSALLKASEKYQVKKRYIITYNSEETMEENGRKIEVLPLWKWLLLKHK